MADLPERAIIQSRRPPAFSNHLADSLVEETFWMPMGTKQEDEANQVFSGWRIANAFGSSLLLMLCALVCGCANRVEDVYSHWEKLKELPTKHREQIERGLLVHFGTPSRPHIRLIASPAADGTASEGASESSPTDASDKNAPTLTYSEWKDPYQLQLGGQAFRKRCASCHGVTGDGKGAVAEYLKPLPRDYRHGVFKFVSTPRSSKPRREDLVRIIQYGAKGTSMPSFRWLEEVELNAIVDYVIHLSIRGEVERQMQIEAETEFSEEDDITPDYFATVVDRVKATWDVPLASVVQPAIPEPPKTEESIEAGRKAFLTRGCQQCHGIDGRGRASDVGVDQWGNAAYAADITAGTLHGGRRPVDIYRRIHVGINGTPMPGFGLALESEPETIWHLVHYVEELAGGRVFPNTDAAELEALGKASAAAAPVQTENAE